MMKIREFVIVLAAFSMLLSALVASCNEPANPPTPSNPTPATANALYDRGLYLMAANKFQDAISAFDQSLALDANNSEAWDSKGYCLYELGRYEESLQSFDKALQIEPERALFLFEKGLTLSALDRCSEALKSYEAAIAAYPSYREALYEKCQCLEKLGRTGEAQACRKASNDMSEFKNLEKPLIER
jgi:tetratricopeptide (TPR) repeat protein